MIMNDELERTRKEVVKTYFEMLSHLPPDTEENREKPLNHGNRFWDRDTNPGLEYETLDHHDQYPSFSFIAYSLWNLMKFCLFNVIISVTNVI
jgi:hypothetical protein